MIVQVFRGSLAGGGPSLAVLAWALASLGGCAEGSSIEGDVASAAGNGAGGPGRGGAGGTGGEGATTGGPGGTTTGASSSSGGEGGVGGDGGMSSGGGEGGRGTTSSTAMSSSATGAVDQTCPPGELVTGVDAAGVIACAPFAAAAVNAFAGGCYLYLGSRDNCDGCTDPPAKWGYARTGQCANGLGANGTCASASLGGTPIQLYGMNTDGDVNDDDKVYATLHCTAGDAAAQPGPCGAFEFVSGLAGNGVMCTPASGVALPPIRESCDLYVGWRDSCDGCTTAPSKWGRASDRGCANGAGAGNTCVAATLGGESVNLLGVNTDGDVNDDDKFHVALHCDTPAPETSTVAGSCPPGQLVQGIQANGTLDCVRPAALATAAFGERCTGYFGWRDNCDACTTAPSKWGTFRVGACANGVGTGNTCVATPLGGVTVDLLGVNTDGDVNDDDKFYMGMLCQ